VAVIAAIILSFNLLSDTTFPSPDLQLQNLQNQTQTFSDFRGKIVVLNFWATWCVPCRKEMPLFVETQKEYGPKGVQFVAASTDPSKDKKKVEQFAKKYNINFPIWTGATTQEQISFRLGNSLPATVILDTNGQPVFRIIGEAGRDTLIQRLDWLLSGRSAPAPEEIVLPPGITPEHWKEHELGLEEDEHEHESPELADASEVPS